MPLHQADPLESHPRLPAAAHLTREDPDSWGQLMDAVQRHAPGEPGALAFLFDLSMALGVLSFVGLVLSWLWRWLV